MKNPLIHFFLLNKDVGTKSVIHYLFFYEGNKLNLFDHTEGALESKCFWSVHLSQLETPKLTGTQTNGN